MKKLGKMTLNKLDVMQGDILPKNELKHIVGGYGDYDGYGDDVVCHTCACLSDPVTSFVLCVPKGAEGPGVLIEWKKYYCGTNNTLCMNYGY